ncbi:hypothetical protein [Streptomyces massasporeus]
MGAGAAAGRLEIRYLLRVFGKLRVDDRTAAVTSAMRFGLLD